MLLARPRNNGFAGCQFPLLTSDVEPASALQNEINLIRFSMAVNPLILSGFQTIEIAKIPWRVEQRYLLHLIAGEPDEIAKVLSFHQVAYCSGNGFAKGQNLSLPAIKHRRFLGKGKELRLGHDFCYLGQQVRMTREEQHLMCRT